MKRLVPALRPLFDGAAVQFRPEVHHVEKGTIVQISSLSKRVVTGTLAAVAVAAAALTVPGIASADTSPKPSAGSSSHRSVRARGWTVPPGW